MNGPHRERGPVDDAPQDHEEARRRRTLLAQGRVLVPKLWGILRTLGLYSPENETPQKALDQLLRCLEEIHREDADAALIIISDAAFLNGTRLRLDQATQGIAHNLSEFFAERSLGGLCFMRGARRQRLMEFLAAVRSCVDEDDPRQALLDHIARHRLAEVALINPQRIRGGEAGDEGLKLEAIEIYARTMHSIATPSMDASSGRQRRRQQVAVRRLVDLGESDPDALIQLGAIRGMGSPILDHTINTTVLSLALGRRAGLNRKHMLQLGLAALNHNIGETAGGERTPAGRPPATTTSDAEHTVRGMRFLLQQYGVNERILIRALVAAEHHRHHDGGGGFPDLPRRRPHLFARIVAICDAYDALLTPRSGSPYTPPDQAVKRITRGAGRLYDPILVRIFVALIGRYPPGCLVELDSGDVAVVIAVGRGDEGQARPLVLRVRDDMGRRTDPVVIDLAERVPGRRRHKASIVRTRDPLRMGINVPFYLMSPEAASVVALQGPGLGGDR